MIFSIANLVYRLLREFRNELILRNFRDYLHGMFAAGGALVLTQEKKILRNLGNKKILGKSQILMET